MVNRADPFCFCLLFFSPRARQSCMKSYTSSVQPFSLFVSGQRSRKWKVCGSASEVKTGLTWLRGGLRRTRAQTLVPQRAPSEGQLCLGGKPLLPPTVPSDRSEEEQRENVTI